MFPLSRLDILTILKPLCLPLFFALILYACKSEGEMEQGIRGADTNTRAETQPTGPLTPAADQFNSGDLPGDSSEYVHVFTAPGEFPYYCRYHGGPRGMGMSGVVKVSQKEGPLKRHTVQIEGYDYPDLDIGIGDTVVWLNTSGNLHTVESEYYTERLQTGQ